MKRNTTYERGSALVIAAVLGLALAVAAAPARAGYSFTKISTLGNAAPGGGVFVNDYEPWGLNSRGETAFVADLTTGGEGVFLSRGGTLSQIVRSGQAAPGGGTFSGGTLGYSALNDSGDVAFGFTLAASPSGMYRYSATTRTLTAIVTPGVTPIPGGGTFLDVAGHASINNSGQVAFPGLTASGLGIFRATAGNQLSRVVLPGDPAPGGGAFDFAANPWINEGGDVAFEAHVLGDPPAFDPRYPNSVYVKRASTGQIVSFAHWGNAAPGGGVYRHTWGPVMNNRGQIAFTGDLTAAPNFDVTGGVFLYSGGSTTPVARPGDLMPGGGHMLTTSLFIGNYALNNNGEVSFAVFLDTDVNSDSAADTGLYVRSGSTVRLVARTGTVIPGVGTIASLGAGAFPPPFLTCFHALNDLGQVAFPATLADGSGVLLLATPTP